MEITGGATVESTSVTDSTLGDDVGSTGTLLLSGSGSELTLAAHFDVGNSGEGTLTVDDGAVLRSGRGYIGHNAGSDGEATVTGADSKWLIHAGSHVYVGTSGTGKLTIADGAEVFNETALIGNGSTGNGTAIAQGAGTLWTNTVDVYVSNNGTSTLTIKDGAEVVVGRTTLIGRKAGSTGVATVTGIGSKLTHDTVLNAQSELLVGSAGHGELNIYNGALVTSTIGEIARTVTSSEGVVTVAGLDPVAATIATATWNNSDRLFVGGKEEGAGGLGTLNVENGGVVTVGNTLKVWSPGIVNLSGGLLEADDLDFDDPNDLNWTGGTLRINSSLSIEPASIQLGNTVTVPTSATLDVPSHGITIGAGGTGVLNVDGGAVTTGSTIDVLASGTVNLSGGLLEADDVDFDDTGDLNWTGGTLRITGSNVAIDPTSRQLQSNLSVATG